MASILNLYQVFFRWFWYNTSHPSVCRTWPMAEVKRIFNCSSNQNQFHQDKNKFCDRLAYQSTNQSINQSIFGSCFRRDWISVSTVQASIPCLMLWKVNMRSFLSLVGYGPKNHMILSYERKTHYHYSSYVASWLLHVVPGPTCQSLRLTN